MGYLPEKDEIDVVRSTTHVLPGDLKPCVSAADLVAFQGLVRRVPVADPVLNYAVRLVRSTRPSDPTAPEFVKKWLNYGGSVRAAQYLVLGSKARALTQGRYHVSFEDVRALALPVLRHRILTNFHAESEGISTDDIVAQLLEATPVPKSEM